MPGLTVAEYAKLYRDWSVEQLTNGTKTMMLGDQSLVRKYGDDLTNFREVKRANYDFTKAGLLDYDGAYPEVSVGMDWVTYSLKYDRAMKLSFDKLDAKEADGNGGGLDLATVMSKLNMLKVVPELDATNMAKCFSVATANTLKSAPTSSTIIKQLRDAIAELEEKGVPLTEMQFFMSIETRNMLIDALGTKTSMYTASMDFVNSNGVAYKLPAFGEIPIQAMPKDRFYTDIKRYKKADQTTSATNVGYTKADTAKDGAWLLVPKNYVLPIVKLSDVKIKMDSVENTTNRNHESAYNIYYDCLVEKNYEPYIIGSAKEAPSAPGK